MKPVRIVVLLSAAAVLALGAAFLFSPAAETADGAPGKAAANVEPAVLTADNFDAVTAEGVVLIDFWAEWCGPCKIIAPIIAELAGEYEGRVVVAKVDIDANPDLARKFKIRSIPNLKILKDGKVVDEIVGVAPKKKIEKVLKKHLP